MDLGTFCDAKDDRAEEDREGSKGNVCVPQHSHGTSLAQIELTAISLSRVPIRCKIPARYHPSAAEQLLPLVYEELRKLAAARLGRLDDVRSMVEEDPDFVRRPMEMVALIGGTAVQESPLLAAKRRGRSEVVKYLLKRGAVNHPQIVWR